MKDFIKWLGVNEKIAKIAVWMLIFMVMLIIINAAIESLGFPHYQITYDNLKHINPSIILDYMVNWIVILLNFYTIMLLVFRIREYKKILKYGMLYLGLNVLITIIFDNAITQIFILIYFITFSYLYSNKNKKYIIYTIISMVLNSLVQGITYMYKVKFVDYTMISELTKAILFTDYFIIMAVIILVKEIYLKKRGENNGSKLAMDRRIQKRRKIR